MRLALENVVKHGGSIVTTVADKGYDSNTIRCFVAHGLGAEAHILALDLDR